MTTGAGAERINPEPFNWRKILIRVGIAGSVIGAAGVVLDKVANAFSSPDDGSGASISPIPERTSTVEASATPTEMNDLPTIPVSSKTPTLEAAMTRVVEGGTATMKPVPSVAPGVGTATIEPSKTVEPDKTATVEKTVTVTQAPQQEVKATKTEMGEKVSAQDAEIIRVKMPDFYYVDATNKSLVKYDKTGFTFEVVDTINLVIKDKAGRIVGWAEHFYLSSVDKAYFYMITDSSTKTEFPIELATKANEFRHDPAQSLAYPLQLINGFVKGSLPEIFLASNQGTVDFTKGNSDSYRKSVSGDVNFQGAIVEWLAITNKTCVDDILKNLDKPLKVGDLSWRPADGVRIVWTDTADTTSEGKISIDNQGRLVLTVSTLPNSKGNDAISLAATLANLAYLESGKNVEVSRKVTTILLPRISTEKALVSYYTIVK